MAFVSSGSEEDPLNKLGTGRAALAPRVFPARGKNALACSWLLPALSQAAFTSVASECGIGFGTLEGPTGVEPV